MPWSIETEAALAADHESVDVPPEAMVAGCAVNWIVGATWFTVTAVLAVAVPPAPVAVMV
jgi:hypothetical protein